MRLSHGELGQSQKTLLDDPKGALLTSQYRQEFENALNLVKSACKASSSGDNSPLSQLDEHYLLQLLKLPWFERVWVVQEVAVAGRLLVICASKEVDGKCFGRLHTRLLNRVSGARLKKRLVELGPLLSYMSADSIGKEKPELLTLLQTFRPWKSTVPHDKVYALRGLSVDGTDAPQLAPNYRLSVEVLNERVPKYMISGYQTISILTYALESPIERSRTRPLPQAQDWTSWLSSNFLRRMHIRRSQPRDFHLLP